MVILEAWAYGKPVVMTPECNLPEGFASGAALRIEHSIEGIQRGLRDLLASAPESLQSMGFKGLTLVAERFNWQQCAKYMVDVYYWLLGSGPKPACVTAN